MFPSVHAIILTWNKKEISLEAIGSVIASTYPNLTVIVVDNASVDGTPGAVRERFPGVVLIENKENLLYAGGNNVGIEYALSHGADYVLLLNDDIAVDREMVGILVEAAEKEGAGMAGPMMYYYPPKGEGGEVIWYAGGRINWWLGMTRHLGIRSVDRGQYNEVTDTDYISGCALLVRADVVRKVGMLDPGYHIYSEDADWCVRAARAGFRVVFVPRARLWHKVSMSSGGGVTPFKVYYKLRSGLRFMRLHAKPYHWLTIPLFVFAGAAAYALKCVLTGNFRDLSAFMTGIFSPRLRK